MTLLAVTPQWQLRRTKSTTRLLMMPWKKRGHAAAAAVEGSVLARASSGAARRSTAAACGPPLRGMTPRRRKCCETLSWRHPRAPLGIFWPSSRGKRAARTVSLPFRRCVHAWCHVRDHTHVCRRRQPRGSASWKSTSQRRAQTALLVQVRPGCAMGGVVVARNRGCAQWD